MATSKQYELLFMLKAQMDSAFGTGFTTAKTYVSELQGKINEYKHALSDINAYQKHQQALTTLNTKLQAEQKALDETKKKIEANGAATKELSDEKKDHEKNINQLNEQIKKEEQALDQTKESLDKSKISTDNLAEAEEDLKAKIDETTKTSEDFAKLDNQLAGIESTFAAIKPAADLAFNGVKALVGGIMDCVNSAGELEFTMSGVKATTGATEEETAKLTATAKYMGATTAYTAQECAEALQTQALAGWSVEEMISGLPAVVQLAAASQEDLTTMTGIVSDSLNAFGLSGTEAVNRFADVLTQASASSNVDVADLGESLSYVESTAANLGYSIEDVSIALSVLGNQALKGSVSGSALNTMLTRMSGANSNADDEMKRLGLSMYDATGQAKDLMTFMNELREAFNDSGMSAQEMQISAYKLAGQRGMRGLLSIVNTSQEEWEEMTDDIYNAAGAAETMTNIQLDNYKGQVYLLTSAWEGLQNTIGEGFLPTATMAAEVLTDVTTAVDTFAQSNQDLLVPLSSGVLLFGGLAGAVGATGTAFHYIVPLIKEFKASSDFFTTFTSFAGMGLGAAGMVTVALTAYQLIKNATSEEANQLTEESDALLESNQTTAESYEDTINSYQEQKDKAEELISTLDTLQASGKNDYLTQWRTQQAVDSLNEALPGLNLEYDSFGNTLSMTTDQMREYNETANADDVMQSKLAQLNELEAQQSGLETEIATQKAAQEEAWNKYNDIMSNSDGMGAFSAGEDAAQYAQNVTDLTNKYNENQEAIDSLTAELGDYLEEQGIVDDATDLTETQLEEITSAAVAYGDAWQEAYDKIQESMSENFDPFGAVDEWESTDLGDVQASLETQLERYQQYQQDIQTIVNSGIDVSPLVDSFNDGSMEAMSQAKALADDITNNSGELVQVLASKASAAEEAISGASAGLADLDGTVLSKKQDLVNALSIDDEGLKASATEAAQGVLNGYTSGLGGDYSSISNCATNIGDVTISSLRTSLDEHSPSHKAQDAGVGVGTGLNKGIASMHASTGNAMYKYGSYAMARAISGINSKKAGLVEAARSAGDAAAAAFKSATSSIGSKNKYATGTTYAGPGWALVGEQGPELMKSVEGLYSIVGANGPQVVPMEGGETVYTASETQELLAGGSAGGIYREQAAAAGTGGAVQTASAAPSARQEQSGDYSGAKVQITYAPQITVNGNADAGEIKKVLTEHNQELLELVESYLTEREASQRRRAY